MRVLVVLPRGDDGILKGLSRTYEKSESFETQFQNAEA